MQEGTPAVPLLHGAQGPAGQALRHPLAQGLLQGPDLLQATARPPPTHSLGLVSLEAHKHDVIYNICKGLEGV